MKKLPSVQSKEELYELIEEIGFIPLFQNPVRGFSVMDITRGDDWFSGDPARDPWHWRTEIAAEGKIAYGKLFDQKAGFISKKWYPVFANFRRSGYDFDSLFEEGLAARRLKLIMDLFLDQKILPSYEIKRLCGFGKGKEPGFEAALSSLQMMTYLTIRGFSRKKNKLGEEYGWPTALYSPSEALFGEEFVRSLYDDDPQESKEMILNQCRRLIGTGADSKVMRLIS